MKRIITQMAFMILLTSGQVFGQMDWYTPMDWRMLSPTTSPPARRGHAMAYDAARQRIVLFGGFDGTQYLNGSSKAVIH